MSSDMFENLMNYSSKPLSGAVSEKPKLKKSEKLLLDIKDAGFNMAELEPAITTKGNQLILSIAGSGKTTSLIFKIMYDITTGEATRLVEVNGNQVRVLDRIWVSTFLKSGADELKNKLGVWQRKFNMLDTSESVQFSTLHAEFKRALTAFGVSTNIIDDSENNKNLKKVVESLGLKYDGKNINSDILSNLKSALTYTRNRLDAKRYDRTIYEELDIGPVIVDSILRQWKQMRKDLNCVDFEDLQELVYDNCNSGNTQLIEFLQSRYSYIYIDEFQDTSQIQYEILKFYAGGVKKVVAIGDDDQTIYSWRGSCNDIIIKNFAEDFSPSITKLSVNYRCPSNILMAIKPSIEMNQNRYKKEISAYKDGGILRFGEYGSYLAMVNNLTSMVEQDIRDGLSVAILCRVNSDGLMPALMLDNLNKFQFTISGDGMTLDSYIGRSVISIAKLFTESSSASVKSTLNQLTWDSYNIVNLMKVCKNNKTSFWDIPDADLSYSCPAIADKLITWKAWRKSMGDLEALKLIYMYFRTEVYVKDTQYNAVCKTVIHSVELLLSVFKGDSVEDFLESMEDLNERLRGRKKKFNGSHVRIATVHEFKGKEADSVYIWNDSEDIYPHKDCDMSDIEEIEEERRVHYIACTRARKISTIISQKNKSGLFVNEMDLSKAEVLVSKVAGNIIKNVPKVDVLCEDNEFWGIE